MAYGSRLQKQADSGQTDIFGDASDTVLETPRLELQPAPPTDGREQLQWERELLGLYLSQHPLELFEALLGEQTVPLNTLDVSHDGQTVSVGGAITDVRAITTRGGQKMAFVKLEDRFGEIEVVLFPSTFQQSFDLWQRDRVVLIRGKVNGRGRAGQATGEVKITVDEARELTAKEASSYRATGRKVSAPQAEAEIKTAASTPAAERVYIRLGDTNDEQTLLSLKQTIDNHRGGTEVVLVLGEAASKQAIKLPGGIDRSSDGLSQLQELVGADNLVIR